MKKLLFILMALPLMAAAQNKAEIKITHGPYLTQMSPDGVTVVWTTDKPALSWAEVAPGGKEHFYASERPKFYDTQHGKRHTAKTVHTVRITGLEPGKEYRYRVFSQLATATGPNNKTSYGPVASTNVYSQTAPSFRTFDPAAKQINFLILNDVHGRAEFLKELVADVDFSQVDFVVLNGDMSNSVESEQQVFTDYMDACTELFARQVPVVYARGNHETRGELSIDLVDYFPTPTGLYYYSFNIGPVCFLVLDGGEDKPDTDIEYYNRAAFDDYRTAEGRWLEAELQTPRVKDAQARVVFLHIPPSPGSWHGTAEVGRTLVPPLNRAGVAAMFSGHTHRYSLEEASAQVFFPVVVNDNNSKVLCTMANGTLTAVLSGPGGKDARRHEFKVRFP